MRAAHNMYDTNTFDEKLWKVGSLTVMEKQIWFPQLKDKLRNGQIKSNSDHASSIELATSTNVSVFHLGFPEQDNF